MRSDIERAATRDEVAGVIALITTSVMRRLPASLSSVIATAARRSAEPSAGST
jgi:hypothetical protein